MGNMDWGEGILGVWVFFCLICIVLYLVPLYAVFF